MFNNIYKGKKVLITGHTGFKGSWLTLWLKKLGAEVTGVSLDKVSDPCHFDELKIQDSINHYEHDIRDREGLIEIFKKESPEIVFHLAARAIVRECYENPAVAFETNVLGSVNVMEAIRNTPSIKAAVMITSDKCYENVEWEYGYREDDKLGGKDPYSASKACAELAFSTYSRSYFADLPINIASARAGNVIGGGDWARDRIVPDCIRSWTKNEKVEVRSPNATRPWQLVLEPLSGYLQLGQILLENSDLDGESFNFGPAADVNQPVSKLIDEMKTVWTDKEWFTNAVDTDKKEAGLLKLCCDKALFKMDWIPTLTFKDTIRMTSKWYFDYYNNNTPAMELTTAQIDEYESIAKSKDISWTR